MLDVLMDDIGRKFVDNAGKIFSFIFGIVGWLAGKLLKKFEESISAVNKKCDENHDEMYARTEALEREISTLTSRLAKLEGAHEVNHKG